MGNWIVLLVEDGQRPVPFGIWHDALDAKEWAETKMTILDGQRSVVTQIRMVSEEDE